MSFLRVFRVGGRRLLLAGTAAAAAWLSQVGLRRAKTQRVQQRPTIHDEHDDVFGSLDASRTSPPERPPRRRPRGGSSNFGVVKTPTPKVAKPTVVGKGAAPIAVARLSESMQDSGLAVLVAKHGSEFALTVRDDTRAGSRIHAADPTFTAVSDVLQRIGATCNGVQIDGDTAVVRSFANPNAEGHWTAHITVGGVTMKVHIVDPVAYRVAARALGLRVSGAVPRVTPANGRQSFAGRDQVQSLRAGREAGGMQRGLERGLERGYPQ